MVFRKRGLATREHRRQIRARVTRRPRPLDGTAAPPPSSPSARRACTRARPRPFVRATPDTPPRPAAPRSPGTPDPPPLARKPPGPPTDLPAARALRSNATHQRGHGPHPRAVASDKVMATRGYASGDAYWARSTFLSILPTLVLGRLSTNTKRSGMA